MDLQKIIINSERLKLISLTDRYAEDIFREFTPEIAEYMVHKPSKNIDEVYEFIAKAHQNMKDGIKIELAILNKENDEFLGLCAASKLKTSSPVLGIWLKKDAQGKKYGREAMGALNQWVFDTFKPKSTTYTCNVKNISSQKTALSIGGKPVGEFQKKNAEGKLMNEIEYQISPK